MLSAKQFLRLLLAIAISLYSATSYSVVTLDPRFNGWEQGFYWKFNKNFADGVQPSLQDAPDFFYSQSEAFLWLENLVYEDTLGGLVGPREFSHFAGFSVSGGSAFYSPLGQGGTAGQLFVDRIQCSVTPNEQFCVDQDPYLNCWADATTGVCYKISEAKEERNTCLKTGNPILIATGNKFQADIDYRSSTLFRLSFTRYYNSTKVVTNQSPDTKWNHNYQVSLTSVGFNTFAVRNDGQILTYNYDGNDWIGDVDIPDTLEEVLDASNVRTGWVYTDSNDNVETYDATGKLLTITNRTGQSQTLVYDVSIANGGDDNPATLDKVQSYTGDELLFTYDSSQRIATLTDPEGNIYHYAYDSLGNLQSVAYPDDTPGDLTDNPTRTYHYENTSFPHHLTGLTDETGSRVTWAYDAEGRTISSELDGGVDKFTLDYTVPDQVTVTNPLGKDITYHFTTLHGVKKVTQVEGHPTANCAGANQNYTYDANGYLQSKTDWQGNITNYVHDARGLETSRTEAVGTPQERTITTTWHPDFRVPLTITEPGKVTTYTYDGVGRQIIKMVEQE